MAGMPAAGAAPMAMHLNDVVYDAFLANDRTLDDPQVIRVEPHGRVRLRVINAAAATNFFLDLGGLEGRLIEVDGNPVAPLPGRRFELATAQRIDLRLALPAGPGAYPVFAQGEGGDRRTGIVLATKTAQVRRLPSVAEAAAPAVGSALESRLRAAEPLSAKPADRRHQVALTGGGADYRWGLNDDVYGAHKPLLVSAGERVEIDLVNRTAMAHPMHLHGHSFQVVALDGRRFSGALRDTLLVPPNAGTTIAFDADNPGNWVFHCHHLYHMHAGMMTTVEYEDLG
jgi:FtsP/CotA-like multicopper oxidase with cupredoxin domain